MPRINCKGKSFYHTPANRNKFEKINTADKSILLFQVGKLGQLALHEQIYGTQHRAQRQSKRLNAASCDRYRAINIASTLTDG